MASIVLDVDRVPLLHSTEFCLYCILICHRRILGWIVLVLVHGDVVGFSSVYLVGVGISVFSMFSSLGSPRGARLDAGTMLFVRFSTSTGAGVVIGKSSMLLLTCVLAGLDTMFLSCLAVVAVMVVCDLNVPFGASFVAWFGLGFAMVRW